MSEQPVIVGVGEWVDRPADIAEALEPVVLMDKAMREAADDSGADILGHIDSIDLVGLVSWRYANPVGLLADRLGIKPARLTNASMGGETPIRLIHEAAIRIARGEQSAAAIVGGEATSSRNKARKAKVSLDWTPMVSREDAVKFPMSSYEMSRPAKKLKVLDPAQVYPFYEMATQAAWGQTPAQAQAESAELWSRFAEVAAENPAAWIRTAPNAAQIATIDADNRRINWPYAKLMVANPSVNQAAAIIVTSLTLARKLGIPDDRIVHIWGGAAANEAEDYLKRDSYAHSSAQAAVLQKASEVAGGVERLDHMELYSCFPVVPKMALRNLGLMNTDIPPTVAGGLTFFGGPLNNYMSHAVAAMTRALRSNPGETGLLYGQGGYVNKHHALIVSTSPPTTPIASEYSVQPAADAAMGPVPELIEEHDGPVEVETYTVTYARDGDPLQGIVIARTEHGKRVMARVSERDSATIAALTSMDTNAVGMRGYVHSDVFGKLNFTASEGRPPTVRQRTRVEREGPLTIVTINRPDSMNSLDPATNAEMAEIFDEFAADPDQWVAIVTGAGDRAFSAGNDLKETVRIMGRGAQIETPITGFGGLTSRFDLDKPVIAAVNGVAMGGGFEVALACDIIVASETAKFALPEPKVGLAALAGGLLRLPAQIGMKQAMGIILTGRHVLAEEGEKLGFVNEVVPASDLMSAARRWAQAILEASPLSVRASKQIVRKGIEEDGLAAAYKAQSRYPAVASLFRSSDLREGPLAFAQKRKPEWKGR